MIGWVADPAFDRDGIVWFFFPSVSYSLGGVGAQGEGHITRMEDVAQWAIVKYHDLAQVRFNLRKVLDVSPVANSAVLPVVSSCKVLALHLQPVDDGISVLLDGCGKYNQIVPFADLGWEGQPQLGNAQVRSLPFSKSRHSTAACERSTRAGPVGR